MKVKILVTDASGATPSPVSGGDATPSPTAQGTSTSSDPDFTVEQPLAFLDGEKLQLFTNAAEDKVRIKIVRNGIGWLGFGLSSPEGSPNHMVGGVVMIGMNPLSNPSNPGIGLYEPESQSGPSDIKLLARDSALETIYGVVNASFSTANGKSALEFTVLLSKQDPKFQIAKEGGSRVIFAHGQEVFGVHENYAFASSVNLLLKTTVPISTENPPYAVPPVLATHFIFMITAWLVLLPTGVMMPLFNNRLPAGMKAAGFPAPAWFNVHQTVQSLGVVITIIGFALGVSFVNQRGSLHFNNAHTIIGLIVFLLAIIQPLNGILRPHKKESGEQSFGRKAWEVGHRALGWCTILLGIINCIIGVNQFTLIANSNTYTLTGATYSTGYSGGVGATTVLFATVMFFVFLVGILRRYCVAPAPVPASATKEEGNKQTGAEAGAADVGATSTPAGNVTGTSGEAATSTANNPEALEDAKPGPQVSGATAIPQNGKPDVDESQAVTLV